MSRSPTLGNGGLSKACTLRFRSDQFSRPLSSRPQITSRKQKFKTKMFVRSSYVRTLMLLLFAPERACAAGCACCFALCLSCAVGMGIDVCCTGVCSLCCVACHQIWTGRQQGYMLKEKAKKRSKDDNRQKKKATPRGSTSQTTWTAITAELAAGMLVCSVCCPRLASYSLAAHCLPPSRDY